MSTEGNTNVNLCVLFLNPKLQAQVERKINPLGIQGIETLPVSTLKGLQKAQENLLHSYLVGRYNGSFHIEP